MSVADQLDAMWRAGRRRRRHCIAAILFLDFVVAACLVWPSPYWYLRAWAGLSIPLVTFGLGLVIYNSGVRDAIARQAIDHQQRVAAIQAGHVRAWAGRDGQDRQ